MFKCATILFSELALSLAVLAMPFSGCEKSATADKQTETTKAKQTVAETDGDANAADAKDKSKSIDDVPLIPRPGSARTASGSAFKRRWMA